MSREWQQDGECAAAAFALGLSPDAAAVQLYEAFAQGKTQAGSFMLLGGWRLELGEDGEQAGQILCLDPDPRILYADL
jgi:hypothetical protein